MPLRRAALSSLASSNIPWKNHHAYNGIPAVPFPIPSTARAEAKGLALFPNLKEILNAISSSAALTGASISGALPLNLCIRIVPFTRLYATVALRCQVLKLVENAGSDIQDVSLWQSNLLAMLPGQTATAAKHVLSQSQAV